MKELVKRPSIIAGALGLILAVVAFVPALMPLFHGHALDDPSKQLELIAGFLCLWVTCIAIIFCQQLEIAGDFRKLHSENKHAAEASNIKLLEALQLGVDLGKDDWLRHKTLALIKLRRDAHDPHSSEEIVQAVEEFLVKMDKRTFHQHYPEPDEPRRMIRLQRAVERAQHYVIAVTLDSGTYLEDFWLGRFSHDYMSVNEEVAKQNHVKIFRVFIVDREVLLNPNHSRRSILNTVIARHRNLGSMGQVRVIAKDRLPSSWKGHDTSFLVCDDIVASESYSLSDGGNTPGYFMLNDAHAVQKLKNLFECLGAAPDENWIE